MWAGWVYQVRSSRETLYEEPSRHSSGEVMYESEYMDLDPKGEVQTGDIDNHTWLCNIQHIERLI